MFNLGREGVKRGGHAGKEIGEGFVFHRETDLVLPHLAPEDQKPCEKGEPTAVVRFFLSALNPFLCHF